MFVAVQAFADAADQVARYVGAAQVRYPTADGGGAWTWAVSTLGESLGIAESTAGIFLIATGILVAVPLLAVTSYSIRRARPAQRPEPVREEAPQPPVSVVPRDVGTTSESSTTMVIPGKRKSSAAAPDVKRVTTQALRVPPRAGSARLVVEADSDQDADGAAAEEAGSRLHRIGRGSLTRIGRESDNDLVLTDGTVHRYHAVVRRTTDAGYVVFDMSGPGGNGVYVNGERVSDAQLHDGDRIALGEARLRFHLDV